TVAGSSKGDLFSRVCSGAGRVCEAGNVFQEPAALCARGVLGLFHVQPRGPRKSSVSGFRSRASSLLAGRQVLDGGASVGRVGEPESLCVLRSEEHTSELQSQSNLVCRLLLEKKKR